MNRVSRAFSDLVLLGVSVVESRFLVACHGQLVFTLDFALHATVLDSVFTHLLSARVFTASGCFLCSLLSHAHQSALELVKGHPPVLIQIELFHEHFDFFFQRGEAVSFSQKVLDLIRGDGA